MFVIPLSIHYCSPCLWANETVHPNKYKTDKTHHQVEP